MAPNQRKPTLPRSLREQLGVNDVGGGSQRHRPRPALRKEARKTARVEKKATRNGPPPMKRQRQLADYDTRSDDLEPHDDVELEPGYESPEVASPPKSILKKSRRVDIPDLPDDGQKPSSRPSISTSVRRKLDEDDEEIAALESKLGIKGKKTLPRAFQDDGLQELLEGLGGEDYEDDQDIKQRKTEGDIWLEQKRKQSHDHRERQKLNEKKNTAVEDKDYASEKEIESEDGQEPMSLDDDFNGFDSEDDVMDLEQEKPRTRENPYVAPTQGGTAPGKYIPPYLRKQNSSESEAMTRLRRQAQGLVNRLTEANLISILGEVERLYRENPRQHVTSILIDLLLTSVAEPTSLPDTLIILPAGFIAAVYKVIGTDFGAQLIQGVTERFESHYSRASATTDNSKETSNLIMLLSELYNFQIVGSNIIFDYIRLFLEKLSELNAELLLKVVRASGPQLRQDDPSSLRDIVTMLRPAVAKAGGEENLTVRTKFMIDTLNDLKNNKMKTGGQAAAVTSEHIVRMKKILGSLNTRSIKGSEPLRIGLKDIQQSEKKGKWWLVGASWSGKDDDVIQDVSNEQRKTRVSADTGPADLFELAREHHMNTDIRRAIFVAIMSGEDYEDAYLRLMKLKLKKVQEYEIPKVLVHCSREEKTYNPYYTLLAKKLCQDKKLKTAFQFCLWDLFKKMGESDDEDAGTEASDGEVLEMRHMVNLAKMFGTLILDDALRIGVLKPLNMSYLQPKTRLFLEVLFITIILQSQKAAGPANDKQPIVNVFNKVKDTPQLIGGLQYFMKKVVSKTDISGGRDERKTVKWACKVAGDTLETLVAIDRAER